jgi:hypothetical protein
MEAAPQGEENEGERWENVAVRWSRYCTVRTLLLLLILAKCSDGGDFPGGVEHPEGHTGFNFQIIITRYGTLE